MLIDLYCAGHIKGIKTRTSRTSTLTYCSGCRLKKIKNQKGAQIERYIKNLKH